MVGVRWVLRGGDGAGCIQVAIGPGAANSREGPNPRGIGRPPGGRTRRRGRRRIPRDLGPGMAPSAGEGRLGWVAFRDVFGTWSGRPREVLSYRPQPNCLGLGRPGVGARVGAYLATTRSLSAQGCVCSSV